jgi:hypothetical protein
MTVRFHFCPRAPAQQPSSFSWFAKASLIFTLVACAVLTSEVGRYGDLPHFSYSLTNFLRGAVG